MAAVVAVLLSALMLVSPAQAANCSVATGRGTTGPDDWQSYCWIDFNTYNDAAARSASGQAMSLTLQDGTIMSFTLKVSGATVQRYSVPTWGSSPFGTSAFTGVTGFPAMYKTGSGNATVTLTNIVLTPPSGSTGGSEYMLVVVDAEATGGWTEAITLTTLGGEWQHLARIGAPPPASPDPSGIGTKTFVETGTADQSNGWGAYVVGTASPTEVSATSTGPGGQAVAFAIRYASIRLTTNVGGARVNAADQFNYQVRAGGTTVASGTTTGTGLTGFPYAAVEATSSLALSLVQTMASGSVSALGKYVSTLTCTNGALSSPTVMPTNVTTTNYTMGSLKYGDVVTCTFTETPLPHLQLTKALSAAGRASNTDQFTMRIRQGATNVATTTTTGTGATVTNGSTPQYQATAGTTYTFSEAASGTTNLANYAANLSCTNANATSTTVRPTTVGGSITPKLGDVVYCTLLNTRNGAQLGVVKTSAPLSDPYNGTGALAKLIPGGVVRYSLQVTNSGPGPVDNNAVFLVDLLPPQVMVGKASTQSALFANGSPVSGLTFSTNNDMRFSNAATAPTSFAGCTYTTTLNYDPAIRYVCFNPKGVMAGSGGTFTISFDAQVK